MGRRDRERIARIRDGSEAPIATRTLNNPVARKAVALASRGTVIEELRKAETSDQIDVLNSQVASSRPDKLRKAIAGKAPKEMDKGIRKLLKESKDVTVDALCAEIKSAPGFLPMCERVGLSLEWFERLAKERMEAQGI